MKPFVSKVKDFVSQDGKFSPGPLEFLNDWESPINDKNLEKLTPLGAKDSTEVRSIQPSKIPPLLQDLISFPSHLLQTCFF